MANPDYPPDYCDYLDECLDETGRPKIDYDDWNKLSAAVAKVEKEHPLPRCAHGNALVDGSGEHLMPTCGCGAFSCRYRAK